MFWYPENVIYFVVINIIPNVKNAKQVAKIPVALTGVQST